MNGAAEPQQGTRGASLLIEHVEALETARPSAHERLERVLGGYLTRLLVSALSGSRRRYRSR